MAQIFCLSLFQILKKAFLRISKYLTQIFCSSLFQILKKHTYESQNTSFRTNNNNLKGNNLHKHHYTNNCHKNHYTNQGIQ